MSRMTVAPIAHGSVLSPEDRDSTSLAALRMVLPDHRCILTRHALDLSSQGPMTIAKKVPMQQAPPRIAAAVRRHGTGSGSRTRTGFTPPDFESGASTSSAIPAWARKANLKDNGSQAIRSPPVVIPGARRSGVRFSMKRIRRRTLPWVRCPGRCARLSRWHILQVGCDRSGGCGI
jgi:hypothetical protein